MIPRRQGSWYSFNARIHTRRHHSPLGDPGGLPPDLPVSSGQAKAALGEIDAATPDLLRKDNLAHFGAYWSD
jgi:hypothetical protein